MKQSKHVLATLVLLCSMASLHSYAAPDKTASAAAHALFNDYWEDQLKDSPEFATFIGDNRYAAQLHDLSLNAIAKRKRDHLALEKKINAIPVHKLSEEDQVSLAVLRFDTHQKVVLDTIFGDQPFSADDLPFEISQMDGIQFQLPQLLRATSLKTARDYDMLLKRLAALPVFIDQQTVVLRAGMMSGWMPAAVAIQKIPAQFDPLLVTDLEKNALYQPFLDLPKGIAADQQEQLRRQAREVISQHVIPALEKMQAFLANEYLPAASNHIAAADLPGKLPYYQAMLVVSNTTLKTPEEIHRIGLAEVDRLEKAMLEVMKETGYRGTPAEFNQFMNSDPQFFFTDPQAMLTSYREIAKRIDARLPDQFETLPRLPYGIRPMMAAEGDGAEHYTSGALDGSRAGYFEANLNNLKRRPNWSMEDLVLHEAVPGHHLQISRAAELTGIPTFRRAYFNSGYAEGWALYAESLGPDLGLYTTPYTRYGYLSAQIFRAARLVVDTGIHAFGMTRDEAVAYLMQHAAVTHDMAVAEVDRYIVWPGQATAYKLGQLDIIALREKAEKALGAKFDIRKFNNQIVDHGALPLAVLDEVINRWIATQK